MSDETDLSTHARYIGTIPVDRQKANSIAGHVNEISARLVERSRDMRGDLFILAALVDTGAVESIGGTFERNNVAATFDGLAELARQLFPPKNHPRKAEFIGQKCSLCAALIVDVDFGRGELPVLICGDGHRTIPDPE